MIFAVKTSRKVIVTRTESDWTAYGIRSDGERNLIGRRTRAVAHLGGALVSARLCRLPEQEVHQPSKKCTLCKCVKTIIFYCCPVNNYSPLYCFVVQCFIAIFTKGAFSPSLTTLSVLPDSNKKVRNTCCAGIADKRFLLCFYY